MEDNHRRIEPSPGYLFPNRFKLLKNITGSNTAVQNKSNPPKVQFSSIQ